MSKATPTRGVQVTLDRERRLRYPLSAVQEIVEETTLVRLIWLGLRHEDDELTEEDVADMVDLETIDDLRDPILEASGGRFDLGKLLGGGGSKKGGPSTPAQKPARKGTKSGA